MFFHSPPPNQHIHVHHSNTLHFRYEFLSYFAFWSLKKKHTDELQLWSTCNYFHCICYSPSLRETKAGTQTGPEKAPYFIFQFLLETHKSLCPQSIREQECQTFRCLFSRKELSISHPWEWEWIILRPGNFFAIYGKRLYPPFAIEADRSKFSQIFITNYYPSRGLYF